MNLLLIRHGKAEEHDFSRWPDDSQRPLSERGIEQFTLAAEQLGRIFTPDVLLTSPYVRAMQTATILHDVAGWPEPQITPAIPNGDYPAIVSDHFGETNALAAVGHQPTISEFAARLISAGGYSSLVMKPGSAAMLRLNSPSTGELRWLAPTRLFR